MPKRKLTAQPPSPTSPPDEHSSSADEEECAPDDRSKGPSPASNSSAAAAAAAAGQDEGARVCLYHPKTKKVLSGNRAPKKASTIAAKLEEGWRIITPSKRKELQKQASSSSLVAPISPLPPITVKCPCCHTSFDVSLGIAEGEATPILREPFMEGPQFAAQHIPTAAASMPTAAPLVSSWPMSMKEKREIPNTSNSGLMFGGAISSSSFGGEKPHGGGAAGGGRGGRGAENVGLFEWLAAAEQRSVSAFDFLLGSSQHHQPQQQQQQQHEATTGHSNFSSSMMPIGLPQSMANYQVGYLGNYSDRQPMLSEMFNIDRREDYHQQPIFWRVGETDAGLHALQKRKDQ